MEENNIAISFTNVSKIYKLRRRDKRMKMVQYFYAIKKVSFFVEKGKAVGILGTNGSGKSTLALLLAGIAAPDEGEIKVNGEQSLVAINTGLNKQLTGLENIELKGALLGLKKKQIDKIVEGVIEFAEIGDFLYQPVKKYSSGMKSRLGFAINLCLDPDIIIVDEALSVGDKAFSQKCLNKMTELKKEGKTIIFISHSLPQVSKFCDSAIWVEGGQLREVGDIKEVSKHYADYVEYYNSLSKENKKKEANRKFDERVIAQSKKSFFKRWSKKGNET